MSRARRSHGLDASTGRDPSYSRVYLTTANYQQQSLLRNIASRTSPLAGSHSHTPTPKSHIMKRDDSPDTDAAPISSSDEEEARVEKKQAAATSNEFEHAIRPTTTPKRAAAKQKPVHVSKRRKLTTDPILESLLAAPSPPVVQEDSLFEGSMPSQSKKRQIKSYAGRKAREQDGESAEQRGGGATYKPPSPVREAAETTKSDTKFVKPEEDNWLLPIPVRPTSLITVPFNHTLLVEQQSSSSVFKPPPDDQSLNCSGVAVSSCASEFRVPDDPTWSSTTTHTDAFAVFDEVEASGKVSRNRSASLSSGLSVPEELDMDQTDNLSHDKEVPCPICGRLVERLYLESSTHARTFTHAKQREFCTKHRLRDAALAWKSRGYPTIDWDELERSRIPQCRGMLSRILHRQKSSYYLSMLDSEVDQASHDRKALQRYLHEGVLEVAKQGYYGPRGAKIMVNTITEMLTKDLKRRLKTDVALRAAGVGGFVSAVLLPELTLRLVMEDMGLDDEDKGRELLVESTELGLLLHVDDDHVKREDDD